MALDFLRGLFGSSGRQYVNSRPNDFRVEAERGSVADRQVGDGAVMKRMPTLTPDLETPKQDRAKKWQVIGATLQDVGAGLRGGQGESLARVQEGWRRQAAREQQEANLAQLQQLATSLYGDDPEAQLLFQADPESFVKARAERFKPQTMSGGQTYIDPATGRRFTAPTVEKFDDRMGYYDPQTGEARYSDPRGPTFQEGTGRMSAEEAARHNREQEKLGYGQLGVSRGNLGVAQGHLGVARAKEGREAGGGGGDYGHMTTQQLIEALRNAR